jgi:hypothetical protein
MTDIYRSTTFQELVDEEELRTHKDFVPMYSI